MWIDAAKGRVFPGREGAQHEQKSRVRKGASVAWSEETGGAGTQGAAVQGAGRGRFREVTDPHQIGETLMLG